MCQSPANEMDLDAGHVAGGWTAWHGLAGEGAEAPRLTLGELSHAAFPCWKGTSFLSGGWRATQGSGCMSPGGQGL